MPGFSCGWSTIQFNPFVTSGTLYVPLVTKELNTHCRTVFSFLDKNDIHLMGQSCPLCSLQVEARLIKPYDAGHFI
jgi:hypothetical protein